MAFTPSAAGFILPSGGRGVGCGGRKVRSWCALVSSDVGVGADGWGFVGAVEGEDGSRRGGEDGVGRRGNGDGFHDGGSEHCGCGRCCMIMV